MRGRTIICDDRDKELWKFCRRFYLTASDLYSWGPTKPWWPGSPEEILAEKVLGKEKNWGGGDPVKREKTLRKLAHGRFNEENNRRKFSHFAKLRTRPTHHMVGNERWPWLAATLDALIVPPKKFELIDPDPFTEAEHVQELRNELLFMEGTGICELKQTENVSSNRNNWFTHTKRNGVVVHPSGPAYNHPQIQAQMHITGCKWGVLVGQIGAVHMQAHLIERDESFADWLDEVNENFRVRLLEYRREAYGE